jgi:squalene-hopene/tetraprenyl-beta-curcumene cyclase
MRLRTIGCGLAVAAFLFELGISTRAAAQSAGPDPQVYSQIVSKAVEYLKTAQAPDGSYSKQTGPAVTALITTGLLRHGRTVTDPQIANSLKFLEGYVRPDGGIYDGEFYRNYETCLAMGCFAEANKDGRYNQILANAEKFVKANQWDGEEGHDISSPNYGGAGYGRSKRPDLSNTSFMLDALKSIGKGADDPAVQRALVFVSRCQNLESPKNTTPFPAKNPDGGFYYTPAAGGVSQAGKTDNGGLRSYASMTYAGLKSMIFAGVGPNDPRVKAAFDWAKKHYDLASNPGMGASGLYYYYHTFAKALATMQVDVCEDAAGMKHDWRRELVQELAKRQQANGSWINTESDRWLEGDPNLVTGYALLTLDYCRPAK